MDYKLTTGQISFVEFWAPVEKALNADLVGRMLKETVKAIGMTPHGDPRIITYEPTPLPPTIVQFLKIPDKIPSGMCGIQPLTESYAIVDFWTDLYYYHVAAGKVDPQKVPPYAYGNYVINSCKKFDIYPVFDIIQNILSAWRIAFNEVLTYYTGDPTEHD